MATSRTAGSKPVAGGPQARCPVSTGLVNPSPCGRDELATFYVPASSVSGVAQAVASRTAPDTLSELTGKELKNG